MQLPQAPGGRGSLPPHGSLRPVRAHSSAYGFSNYWFIVCLNVERTLRTGASGYRFY